MKPKTRKLVNAAAALIPAAMVIMSGILKFNTPPEMKESFAKIGIEPYLPMLGIMEITFSLLFIFPQTLRIGFILLSCYFAGALATEMANQMPFNALLPMALVWTGAFIRDRSIFLPLASRPATSNA